MKVLLLPQRWRKNAPLTADWSNKTSAAVLEAAIEATEDKVLGQMEVRQIEVLL